METFFVLLIFWNSVALAFTNCDSVILAFSVRGADKIQLGFVVQVDVTRAEVNSQSQLRRNVS